MASKPFFGASVVPMPAPAEDDILRAPQMLDSPALTPAASHEDMSSGYLEKPIPPHSPFYQHPPASSERVHSRQSSKNNVAVVEKDLEEGNATPLTTAEDENPFTTVVSVDPSHECKMWPSKKTLLQIKLEDKKRRRDRQCCAGCGPVRDFWSRLDKRQKLLIQLAIALFVVGVMVAIGVGISKAVNGTYNTGNGSQQQVGHGSGGS